MFRSCQSQLLLKLYSNVFKTYTGVLLVLICREWLLQLHILCALSNKKDIKKNIPQSRAKFVCSVPKSHVVWPHWYWFYVLFTRPVLYKNSIDCLTQTVRHEGVMALYKGFVPTYCRLVNILHTSSNITICPQSII